MATSQHELPQDETGGLSRRSMLGRSAAGLGIALTGSLNGLFGSEALGHGVRQRPPAIGYGPLVDDPAGRLALPEGFSYSIVAQSGVTTLETGEPTPSDPDGTASFAGRRGGSVLVNNHEVGGGEAAPGPARRGVRLRPGGGRRHDDDRGRPRTASAIREYVSLAGTQNNCAGGRTPGAPGSPARRPRD